jgi:hypothetical protein
MPVAHYPVYLVSAVDPSWSAYWAKWTALPFWPSGQLWFLWYLLALNVIAVAIFRLAPSTGALLARLSANAGPNPRRYFLGLVAVSALAYVPLAAVFKPWQWLQYGPFAFQPGFTLVYVTYFFAGVGIGIYGLERGPLALDGMLARRWAVWVGAAAAGFLLWIIPTALTMDRQAWYVPALEILADVGLVISCATACFALAAIFLRFAAAYSAVFDSLSANAYGIYLVHYVFVIWLQYLVLGLALFAIVKGLLVFAAALLLSWITTAAVCRVPIGARLMRAQRVLARAR